MSCAAFYNICLKQGDTYAETFILRNKVILSSAAMIGDGILNVIPIPHTLLTGDTLTFGTVTVTLSADAAIGDRTLSVAPITDNIPKSTSARSAFLDLTGKSARASIRQEFLDTAPLVNFTCSIKNPPTSGEVTISLSSADSAALLANTTPGKVRAITNLQSSDFPTAAEIKTLFTVGLQPAPYYYDLEIYDSGSPPVVTKYITGRVVVLAEATK